MGQKKDLNLPSEDSPFETKPSPFETKNTWGQDSCEALAQSSSQGDGPDFFLSDGQRWWGCEKNTAR